MCGARPHQGAGGAGGGSAPGRDWPRERFAAGEGAPSLPSLPSLNRRRGGGVLGRSTHCGVPPTPPQAGLTSSAGSCPVRAVRPCARCGEGKGGGAAEEGERACSVCAASGGARRRAPPARTPAFPAGCPPTQCPTPDVCKHASSLRACIEPRESASPPTRAAHMQHEKGKHTKKLTSSHAPAGDPGRDRAGRPGGGADGRGPDGHGRHEFWDGRGGREGCARRGEGKQRSGAKEQGRGTKGEKKRRLIFPNERQALPFSYLGARGHATAASPLAHPTPGWRHLFSAPWWRAGGQAWEEGPP